LSGQHYRPNWELCIHGEGVLIAATLRTKESAISSVSGAVSGSSLDRPIMIVLISVSSCTGTSLTILSNKLIKKQNNKVSGLTNALYKSIYT